MKTPRGVSVDRLIRVLETMGYSVVRQRGSHIRLRHEGTPRHSITIPAHAQIKTGTLHSILSEVAQARSVPIESIIELL